MAENERLKSELAKSAALYDNNEKAVTSAEGSDVQETAIGNDKELDRVLRALTGSSKKVEWVSTEKGWADSLKVESVDGELASLMQQLVDAQSQVSISMLILFC